MRLLLSLILSLTGDEAASLSKLRLRGKQRAVMQMLLAARTSGREPTKAETGKLELSASHLYQIISLLLDRCERVLVPDGGKALLEFFACKNLHILFKNELQRQEKQLAVKEVRNAEDFYQTVFELLLGFSYNLLDHKLIEEYARLYLASKKNRAPEDELAVKVRLLSIEMTAIRAEGKNPKKEREAIGEVLQEYEKLARNSSHPYFSFSVYSALAWYWRYLGAKPDVSLRYMQRAVPFAEKLEGFIFRDVKQEMQLRLADAYFNVGSATEALEIFERVYTFSDPRSMIWKRNSCLFSYLIILLYNGNYAKATQILTQYIQPAPATLPSKRLRWLRQRHIPHCCIFLPMITRKRCLIFIPELPSIQKAISLSTMRSVFALSRRRIIILSVTGLMRKCYRTGQYNISPIGAPD